MGGIVPPRTGYALIRFQGICARFHGHCSGLQLVSKDTGRARRRKLQQQLMVLFMSRLCTHLPPPTTLTLVDY